MHYQVEGQGPVLLLIHGFGMSYSIWKNLRVLLRPYFQLILIELPGIGDTPFLVQTQSYYIACANEIEHLRQQLNCEQWAILSYSTGTRVAEAYIERYPQRVSQATFLCPLVVSRWKWLALRTLDHIDARFPQLGNWALSGWRLHTLTWWLAFNGRRYPDVAEWTSEIGRQPIQTLKATLRDLPDPGHKLLTLSIATLFIWAAQDRIPSMPAQRTDNQRVIAGTHTAPLLAAQAVAELAIPFHRASEKADDPLRAYTK